MYGVDCGFDTEARTRGPLLRAMGIDRDAKGPGPEPQVYSTMAQDNSETAIKLNTMAIVHLEIMGSGKTSRNLRPRLANGFYPTTHPRKRPCKAFTTNRPQLSTKRLLTTSRHLDSNTLPLLRNLGLQLRVKLRQGENGRGDNFIAINDPILLLRGEALLPASSKILQALLGGPPLGGELGTELWLVMAEVQRDIGKGVTCLGFLDKRVDGVCEVTLVLGTRAELFAGHADHVGLGVVASADQLEEGLALGLGEVRGCQILGGKLDNNLRFSGVLLTHVGCVTEAEDVGLRGQGKGLCEFCIADGLVNHAAEIPLGQGSI